MSNSILKNYFHTYLPHLSEDGCICNACRHKFTQKSKNPVYTPGKTRSKQRPLCYLNKYDMCSTISVADSSISLENFQFCFPSIKCSLIPSCVSLCSFHKSFIYNLQSNAKCVVCGVILLNCRKYACTNLDINNAYLQLNISIDEVKITTSSSLCFTCYSVAKRKVAPVTQLDDVEASLESRKEMSHTKISLCITCKEICKLCNNHEAFLLADMYDFFLSVLKLKCGEASCLESCKRSSRWLLSGILKYLGI